MSAQKTTYRNTPVVKFESRTERIKCPRWWRADRTAALHSTPQWRRLRIYVYPFLNAERGSVALAMPHRRKRPFPSFGRCLSACAHRGTAAVFCPLFNFDKNTEILISLQYFGKSSFYLPHKKTITIIIQIINTNNKHEQ